MKYGGGCADFAKFWRCCTTKLQVCEHYNKWIWILHLIIYRFCWLESIPREGGTKLNENAAENMAYHTKKDFEKV